MSKLKKIKYLKLEQVIFHTVNSLFMLGVIVAMLYPFWNTVAISLSDSKDALRGGITVWPRVFSLYSYQVVFKNPLLLRAFFNSVLRTSIATFLGVFVASLIGFVLSRDEFVWKKGVTKYFIVTMYVNAGLIPTYFLIKDLGLLNNFWVYVLPTLVNVFNIIVVKSYMQGLPPSLVEAAKVDGAGYFRCYVQIVLPMCKPVLATVALWCAVFSWNSWFDTFLYASSNEELTTLQYEMMKLLSSAMNNSSAKDATAIFGQGDQVQSVTPATMRAAVTVVSSLPILMVYPFLQRYFVKGVTLGAVKG